MIPNRMRNIHAQESFICIELDGLKIQALIKKSNEPRI